MNDSLVVGITASPPGTTDGSDPTTHLFTEFASSTKEQWRTIATKELSKGGPEKSLLWTDEDGIGIEPMYFREDLADLPHLDIQPAEPPFVRGAEAPDNTTGIAIAQEIDAPDPADANAELQHALKNGQNTVSFIVRNPHAIDCGAGVHIRTRDDMWTLLRGIALEKYPLHFRAGLASDSVHELLVREISDQGLSPAVLRGACDYDPVSALALDGALPRDSFDTAAAFVTRAHETTPAFRVLGISSEPFAGAGATIAQELALLVAAGCDTLRHMTDRGVAIDVAAHAIHATVAIGTNFFAEIAKLRAARMLWAKIVGAFGATDEASLALDLHTRTSSWQQTLFDPHVNILRATVESMAATIGGSATQTIRPFDGLRSSPSELGARLARNTHIVLQEEALLSCVTDPVAGSYYVENLTDAIARRAWSVFQDIEAAGGLLAALESGLVHDMLAESLERKRARIALKKDVLIGSNQYPNLTETANLAKTDTPAARPRAMAAPDAIVLSRGPLRLHRAAEDIEALRLAVEQGADRPRALLATFGTVFWRRARAAFASGFLGAAGLDVIDNFGFEHVDEAVAAAAETRARIVVACAEDELYPALVPDLVAALRRNAPDTIVIVAGYPKDAVDALRAAGVDEFIHVKANLVTVLSSLLDRLGIRVERRPQS